MTRVDGNTPILNEQTMRGLGFTDHAEGRWYLSRRTYLPDVSFTVTIDKETGDYEELVIDDSFCQPYHYGRYGQGRFMATAVDAEVTRLQEAGLTISVDHREYGVSDEDLAAHAVEPLTYSPPPLASPDKIEAVRLLRASGFGIKRTARTLGMDIKVVRTLTRQTEIMAEHGVTE